MVEDTRNKVSVYPNPTNGTFILQCGKTELPLSATLYHISGKMVFSKSINTVETELKIDGPAGMYLLKLETANGHLEVLRLIKK